MLLENKQVAIIGGGPGGLMLATLLQIKGVQVKVYERDFNRNVRVQGATLDLHQQSGLKAMREAGLMDSFKETYRPGADKIRVVDKHAKILHDEHNEVSNEDLNSEWARPEIDRGPLRELLLNALQPDTVIWDSRFISMSPVGHAWQLEFKNGTTAIAEMVIGADGANSNIRPFVTSDKPFYSGFTIIQGNVENSETAASRLHQLLKGGKVLAFGREKYIHLSAKGDGSMDFYIGCKMNENQLQDSGIDLSDSAQVLDWFKNELPEWDSIWLELCESASLPLMIRQQYCMPLDQHWDALPNLTLLGDAAHIMPPSGEGVNLAMLDALELCECLTGDQFSDTQTAIAAYEQQMRPRAAEEAQESLKMSEWMHAEGALAKMMERFNPARK